MKRRRGIVKLLRSERESEGMRGESPDESENGVKKRTKEWRGERVMDEIFCNKMLKGGGRGSRVEER